MEENKSIINWELYQKLKGGDQIKIHKEIMKNAKKEIGLINYEGDVLKVKRVSEDELVIYDQWDGIVEILDREKFCNWLDGEFPLVDGDGRKWVFTEQHRDARTPLHVIFEYIK
jgi:hypothetical protein